MQVASRVASSLNTALSLSCMNTASTKEYTDLAVRLCTRPEALLAGIRRRVRAGLGTVLFNSERFAGRLEQAYQAVYELYPTFKHVYHLE
jgi:predicted O-linked N-acetylglucosamine transferase (SPINDLY family)